MVRLMAPFNMRCKTCGEYIYKGKKFNARKETVQNEKYLELPIFRFYIKCTRCLAEITFKTDPENTDYAMEHGATRNFQAEKLIEEEEKRFQKEREEEELNNPMKVLENRTKDSKMEMDVLENLQELKELNQRQANVDFDSMLVHYRETEEEIKRRQEEEDEREMRAMLNEAQKRQLAIDSDSDEEHPSTLSKQPVNTIQTDILAQTKKLCNDKLESKRSRSQSHQIISSLVKKQKTTGLEKQKTNAVAHSETAKIHCKESLQHKGDSTEVLRAPAPSKASSLSLLGMYTDSEESD